MRIVDGVGSSAGVRRRDFLRFAAGAGIAAVAGGPAGVEGICGKEEAFPERVVRFPRNGTLGQVCLFHPDHQTRFLEATGDVHVPSGAWVVLDIGERGAGELRWLGRLNPGDVRMLSLERLRIDAVVMRHIQRLTGLDSLFFHDCTFEDAALSKVDGPGGMGNLGSLMMRGEGICNRTLALAANMPQLSSLLVGGRGVTNEGLRCLGHLRNLEDLHLECPSVDDEGLKHLHGLTELKLLHLNTTGIRGFGLFALPYLAELEDVGLSYTPFDCQQFAQWPTPNRLDWLELRGMNLTDDVLPLIAGLLKLTNLDIGDTEITDKGRAYLRSLPGLCFWP